MGKFNIEGAYITHDERNKLLLFFPDRDSYAGLDEEMQKAIKKNFLWSRSRNAWVGRTAVGYVPSFMGDWKITYVQNEDLEGAGERLERLSEKAERKSLKYSIKSNKTSQKANDLQSEFRRLAKDWSWLTQPNVPTSGGRRFSKSRNKVTDRFEKGLQEHRRASYFEERSDDYENLAKEYEGRLKNTNYILNRIKEAEKTLKNYSIEEAEKRVKKAHETQNSISIANAYAYLNRLRQESDKLGFFKEALSKIEAEKQATGEMTLEDFKTRLKGFKKELVKYFSDRYSLNVERFVKGFGTGMDVYYTLATDKELPEAYRKSRMYAAKHLTSISPKWLMKRIDEYYKDNPEQKTTKTKTTKKKKTQKLPEIFEKGKVYYLPNGMGGRDSLTYKGQRAGKYSFKESFRATNDYYSEDELPQKLKDQALKIEEKKEAEKDKEKQPEPKKEKQEMEEKAKKLLEEQEAQEAKEAEKKQQYDVYGGKFHTWDDVSFEGTKDFFAYPTPSATILYGKNIETDEFFSVLTKIKHYMEFSDENAEEYTHASLEEAKKNALKLVKKLEKSKEQESKQKPQKTEKTIEKLDYKNIKTDPKRFQNRAKLNNEVVQNIAENFDINQFDPIVVWEDPQDGKTYVLAGHHRLEGAKKANQTTIPIRMFEGNEKEAIQYAKELSNANRTLETPLERAKIYRKELENKSYKEVYQKAKKLEGANTNYVLNLAFLEPNGKIITALVALSKTSDVATAENLKKISDWAGEARKKFPALTTSHENEIYDFLMADAFRTVKTKRDFMTKIQGIAGAMTFDTKQALNLKRIKGKTQGETEYERQSNDLKKQIADVEAKRDSLKERFNNPKHPQYIAPSDPEYDQLDSRAEKQQEKYKAQLKALRQKYLQLQQQKGKMVQGGLQQLNLFAQQVEEVSKALPKTKTKVAKTEKAQKEVTNLDELLAFVKDILLDVKAEKVKMSEKQILEVGKAIHQILRGKSTAARDAKNPNKRMLAPTYNNLLRWSNDPGRYDMAGVDAPKDAKPTVVARKVKRAKIFNLLGIK